MSKFTDIYRIESSRLQNWDYSTPGYYFITICTLHHNNFFGKIIDNQMVYSPRGEIAHCELLKTIRIRQNIIIDPWVIMPNHVHLLIQIKNTSTINRRDVLQNVSTKKDKSGYFSSISPKSNSISSVIREYKSAVTRLINPDKIFFAWQSRFYDHIINTRSELFAIKQYIKDNPKNWGKDPLHC